MAFGKWIASTRSGGSSCTAVAAFFRPRWWTLVLINLLKALVEAYHCILREIQGGRYTGIRCMDELSCLFSVSAKCTLD